MENIERCDKLNNVNSTVTFLSDALCHGEPGMFTIGEEAGQGLYCIFNIIHDAINDVIADLEKKGAKK